MTSIGSILWKNVSHFPPLSSTELAIKIIPTVAQYIREEEEADWDDPKSNMLQESDSNSSNLLYSSVIFNSDNIDNTIQSVAQQCVSKIVGAAMQVFFAMPFAVWNGILGSAKVVVAFIGARTNLVEADDGKKILQHGLYMAMVAVIDLVIAAAICTIVIPVGYALYMALHPNLSMKRQSEQLIGNFYKPVTSSQEASEVSWAQRIAFQGQQFLLL